MKTKQDQVFKALEEGYQTSVDFKFQDESYKARLKKKDHELMIQQQLRNNKERAEYIKKQVSISGPIGEAEEELYGLKYLDMMPKLSE